jgi:hypothetical protein
MEILWIITGALLPAALALGGALMGDSSFAAHVGACIAFFLAAAWLVGVGGMWMYHRQERDWTVWLRGAAMAVYVAGVTPYLIWVAWPAHAQTPPSINGNCNNIGSNNFNCNTLNVVPQKLRFTDAVGEQLLSTIPKGLVNVQAVGSLSDQNVGFQIANFLKSHGYFVQISRIGQMMPPPDRPLMWDAASATLTVAPSVR